MHADASPWARYWMHQTAFDDAVLARNAGFFLRASEPQMAYSARDRVLDIGCGPGDLISALAPRVRQICGLDTAPRYVEALRRRYAGSDSVLVELLGEDYTDFSVLGDRRFDKILCVSVIQYYRDKEDVRALLREVRRFAAPGARFLIGDILIRSSLMRDVLSLLRSALMDGEPLKVAAFLYRARASEYGKLRREVGLLSFEEDELRRMAREERLDAEVIRNLTVNRNRTNLLVKM